jgi:hypothetical protein
LQREGSEPLQTIRTTLFEQTISAFFASFLESPFEPNSADLHFQFQLKAGVISAQSRNYMPFARQVAFDVHGNVKRMAANHHDSNCGAQL